MYVNRTAKNNPEKHFFELLQIRNFLTDDVTVCCHENKSVTYIQFYHTIKLLKLHWDTCYSFRDIGRGRLRPHPHSQMSQKAQSRWG